VKPGDEGSLPDSAGRTKAINEKMEIGIRLDTIAGDGQPKAGQKFIDRLTGIVAHEGSLSLPGYSTQGDIAVVQVAGACGDRVLQLRADRMFENFLAEA
jgi:hypothetical protein